MHGHAPGGLERERLLGAGLTAEECLQANAMEWKRKIVPDLHPGLSPNEHKAALEACAVNAEIQLFARLWTELARILGEVDCSGRVLVEDGGLRLRWADEIRSGWRAPTLYLDATLEPDLAGPFCQAWRCWQRSRRALPTSTFSRSRTASSARARCCLIAC